MSMNIIITGATGLVATQLADKLLEKTDHHLILVSRNPDKIKQSFAGKENRITALSIDELAGETATRRLEHADICVHTAFSRSSDSQQLAESLEYTRIICHICKDLGVSKFINLSSQSVYGNDYPLGITEEYPCAPSYMYALGKYSSELICEGFLGNSNISLYNIRLASVAEKPRFFFKFIHNALTGIDITVTAPRQIVSFIDSRDVASALISIIEINYAPAGCYNLGTGAWYDILTVADIVKKIGTEKFDIKDIRIVEIDNGTTLRVGMNVDKFKRTFNWSPLYSFEDMVTAAYNLKMNEQ